MIRLPICFALAFCLNGSALADEIEPSPLDWLTGCWQNASGEIREVWSDSEDGYYFGYSVVMQDEQVVFFEQMRIDPGPAPIFNAYPSGLGPSAFPGSEMANSSITFENPDHDYPQKIRYERDGDKLKAVISRIDDSDQRHFDYRLCPS
jgi:hypothetical protein